MTISAMSSRTASRMLGCTCAALLGGALYLNALHNPFVYDDFRTVVDNGSIASLRDLATIVLHEATRPLTNLSFAVDRSIWGDGPFGFHVTNVLLHVLNVVLVFLLVSRVWRDSQVGSEDPTLRTETFVPTDPTLRTETLVPTDPTLRTAPNVRGETLVATVAAMLFAAHPMMTEAVGYISSRSDLLCAALFMAAFLAARRWLLTGATLMLVLTWALWTGALLAKETAAMFPLVLLAYAFSAAPVGPSQRRHAAMLIGPLLVVMLAAATARVIVFVRLEHGPIGAGWTSMATAAVAFWDYVRLLCTAAGQTIFHATRPVTGAGDGRLWLAIALFAAALVAVARYRRRAPAAAFGACWFTFTLAPAALLGAIDGGSAVAEHRAYLPAVGFFLLAGALAAAAAPLIVRFRSTRLLARLAFAAIVLMLSGRTYMRNMVWADPVNLWQEATSYAPTHPMPFAVLGESLHASGRHEEAVAAYRQSMALRPDSETAAVNLVVCLSELSREDDARVVMDGLEHLRPSSAYVPIGRGAIAAIGGRAQDARPLFLEAIVRDPANVMARQWLAILAEEGDDKAEALHRCYELQRLAPGRLSIDACIERSK